MKRRGQGSIFQQPGTTLWTIQYYAPDAKGKRKRIRKSTGTANRNEAVKLLNQRLAAIGEGKLVGPAVEKTTLAQMLAMVEADYRANSRRSLDRAQQAASHLRRFFGAECRARAITHDRITAYVAQRLGESAKPATVNYEQALLRRAFRLGVRAGKVSTRPEVAMLHVDNARRGFFETEQFRAVRRHLPDYLKPVAEAAYITGWRTKSELLTRQWRHVDLNGGWLFLETGEGKTGQGPQLPAHARTSRHLRDAAQVRACD
jgi:integrase